MHIGISFGYVQGMEVWKIMFVLYLDRLMFYNGLWIRDSSVYSKFLDTDSHGSGYNDNPLLNQGMEEKDHAKFCIHIACYDILWKDNHSCHDTGQRKIM